MTKVLSLLALFAASHKSTSTANAQFLTCEVKPITHSIPEEGTFSKIITAVQDGECGSTEADFTYQVPTRVGFSLYPNDSNTTEIFTTLPNMVVPFVQDGALQFRWSTDLSINDEEAPQQVHVSYNPVTITHIETLQDPSLSQHSFTGDVQIGAPWGVLTHVVNHLSLDLVVDHGNALSNQYPPPRDTLMLQYYGAAGSVQLTTTQALTVDIQGSRFNGSIIAELGVSGVLAGERNELRVSSSHGATVTTSSIGTIAVEGTENTLYLQEDGGCDSITITGDGNICTNISSVQPAVTTHKVCSGENSVVEVNCWAEACCVGGGTGSDAAFVKVGWIAFWGMVIAIY